MSKITKLCQLCLKWQNHIYVWDDKAMSNYDKKVHVRINTIMGKYVWNDKMISDDVSGDKSMSLDVWNDKESLSLSEIKKTCLCQEWQYNIHVRNHLFQTSVSEMAKSCPIMQKYQKNNNVYVRNDEIPSLYVWNDRIIAFSIENDKITSSHVWNDKITSIYIQNDKTTAITIQNDKITSICYTKW